MHQLVNKNFDNIKTHSMTVKTRVTLHFDIQRFK